MRVAIWGCAVVCALVSQSWLEYVTALVGINSLFISVLLPLLFYLQLHHTQMGRAEVAAYLLVVALAVLLSLVISYVDVLEFLEEIRSLG